MTAAASQEKVIRIRIDPTGSQNGAQAINQQLRMIMQSGQLTNTSMAQLRAMMAQYGGAAGAAAGRTSVVRTGIGSLGATAAAATSSVAGLNGALGGLALAGAATGVLALAGALTYVVATSNEYVDKLAQISTLIDTSTFNMSALSAGLKEQASLFGQDPLKQAAAAYEIISSGASTASAAIATLNASNTLASVGATTVETAANGVTSALNAWAGMSLTAADATDSMFVIVRDGKISMEELSSSIGQVAPLAATLNISLDDVGASIAALTLSGVQGSVAINNIRAALTAIIKPSSEASKLATKLGLDFSSSALKAKGWPAFLDDVAKKTKGSQDDMAVLMGGVEALSAVLSLTTTANKAFNNSLDNMRDKSGAAADALKKIQDASPGFQLQRIFADVKVAAIEMGEALSVAVVPVLKAVADNFMTAFQASKWLLASFAAYKAVSFTTSIMAGANALQLLGKAATALNVVIGVATKAQALFNVVVLANPYAAAAAAIVLVVGLLYQFSDAISLGSGSMGTLADFMNEVWASVAPMVDAAKNSIGSFFTFVGEGFSSAFGGVSAFLLDAFSGPLDNLKTMWNAAFGDLDFSLSGLLIGAARVADGIFGVFRGSVAAIKVLFDEIPGAMWASFSPGFQTVLSGLKFFVVTVGKGLGIVMSSLGEMASGAMSMVASAFNSVSAYIERLANGVIKIINSVIGGANKLGAGLAPLAEVKIGKMAPPSLEKSAWSKVGNSAAAAFAGGFGNEAEKSVRGLLDRANARGKARAAGGQNAAGGVTNPVAPAGGAGDAAKDAGKAAKSAADKAKAENDFWATLKAEVETSKLFGLEAAKFTKERELHKILGRELNAIEQSNIALLMAAATQNKATASVKEAIFDTENKSLLLRMRAKGLTEEQGRIEDMLDAERLKALKSGADINNADYKMWLAKYRVTLETNTALQRQGELIKSAGEFAKKYSLSFDSGEQMAQLAKDRDNFIKQFNGGEIKDAFGVAITPTVRDAILAGADAARARLANAPLAAIAGSSITAQAELDRRNAKIDYKEKNATVANAGLDPVMLKQINKELAQDFQDKMAKANFLTAADFADKMTDAFDGWANIADVFSKKVGDAIRGLGDAAQRMKQNADPNGSTSKAIGMLSGEAKTGYDNASSSMMNVAQGVKDLKNPLGKISDAFSGPKGGSLAQGIGAAVGGAMQGYQIGSTIGGIGKAVGIRGFETGAKIGGTIGGLTGNPIIAAAASVIGGAISALLYKKKEGSATITGGTSADISVSGNGGAAKKIASGMAGSVQQGLADIAAKFGGSVGSFQGISIGQRDKQNRVNLNGTSLKLKNGAIEFGEDQQGAINFAISEAIKRGAIVGLSDFANKALQSLGADAALALVDAFKEVTDGLDALKDPVGSAVRAITTPLDSLMTQMRAVGASSADLAKVEEYRSLKLQEVLKSQLSSINDFMDTLKGSGSGVTEMSRLTADMAKFAAMKSDIGAGKQIDQDAYLKLGQEIFQLAASVYGTATTEFQNIRGGLIDATTGLAANVTQAFNTASIDPTSAVIAANSAANVSATQAVQNQIAADNAAIKSYLAQMTASMMGGASYSPTQEQLRAINGQYVGAAY